MKEKIKIVQYDKEGKFIEVWPSAYLAGKVLGIKHPNITANLKGRRKSCGGYIFKYYGE